MNLFSFNFPACTECNTTFSRIEAQAKPVVEKILKDDYVSAEELLVLLDWFDKIRICLWLAMKIRNSRTFDIEPKYYVNTRVGIKDRALAITNTYDGLDELWWTGMHTLGFVVSPTCFTMKINNVIFNNCSMDLILSEQLGFPYPLCERKNPKDENLQDFLFTEGKEELAKTIFKTKFYPDTILICQPIFTGLQNQNHERYNTDYVRKNCYDWENGKGKIFVSHGGRTYPMEIDEEISFASNNTKPKRLLRNKVALGFQLELLTSRKVVYENEADQNRHREVLKNIIAVTEEQIRQYNY